MAGSGRAARLRPPGLVVSHGAAARVGLRPPAGQGVSCEHLRADVALGVGGLDDELLAAECAEGGVESRTGPRCGSSSASRRRSLSTSVKGRCGTTTCSGRPVNGSTSCLSGRRAVGGSRPLGERREPAAHAHLLLEPPAPVRARRWRPGRRPGRRLGDAAGRRPICLCFAGRGRRRRGVRRGSARSLRSSG